MIFALFLFYIIKFIYLINVISFLVLFLGLSGFGCFFLYIIFFFLLFFQFLLAHCFCNQLWCKLNPQIVKVFLILFHKFGVLYDYKIFLVHCYSLRGPIKRSGYEDYFIDYDIFIVHMRFYIIIGSTFYSGQIQAINFSSQKFRAFIVAD